MDHVFSTWAPSWSDVGGDRYGRVMRRERFGRWTVLVTESRRERARGLLGRDGLDPWTALLLPQCRSVHSMGMRFAIDVVVLDRQWRPVGIVTLRSGRIAMPRWRARHIVEVAAGRGPAFSASLAGSTTLDALGSARPRRSAA